MGRTQQRAMEPEKERMAHTLEMAHGEESPLEVPAACKAPPLTSQSMQWGCKGEPVQGHAAMGPSQPPSTDEARQQQPAHHQRQRRPGTQPFRKSRRLKDGGGSSIPASSSPLLTHLAAKGLPVGKKPSATDSFAQVLRESLEQPHLSGTTQQRQQHDQQSQQQQQVQEGPPRHPSPSSQHRAPAAAAAAAPSPPLPPSAPPDFTHVPPMAPAPTMPSPSPATSHALVQQTNAEEAEEAGGRSGDESDDEGSSSSSSSSSTASSNDSASYCSCSSSLQDIDSSLSPFQDWASPSLDWECNGQPPHPAGPTPLHSQPSSIEHAKQQPDIAGVADKVVPGSRKSLHHHQHPRSHHHHHHHHHHSHDEMHPAVEAFLQDSLAFAFSGGGFFFPYSLGCVIQLADMGLLTDRTPLAGASCGAIIVACVNAGLDLHGLVPQLLEFAADCRTFGTAGRLRSVIEKFMRRALPPDAHLRCRGTCFLSLTKVFPYLKTCVISDYTSKEDLVQAIATSCHIPAYNDGSFVKEFRGQYFVDGGLIRHIPALPLDHPASYVAGVSCVPFKFLENLPGVQRLRLLRSLSVSPDMFDTFPFAWSEIGGLILAPAEDPVLLQMVEMGKRDILQWVASVGLGPYVTGPRYKGIPPPTFPPLFCPPQPSHTSRPSSPLHQQHPPKPTATSGHMGSRAAGANSHGLKAAGTDDHGLTAAATAPARLLHLRSSSSARDGQGHSPTSRSNRKRQTPGVELPRSTSIHLPVSATTKSDLAAATAAATAAAAAAAAAQLPMNARSPSPGYAREGPAAFDRSAYVKKEAGNPAQPSLLPRSSTSSCDGAYVPPGAPTPLPGRAPAWSHRSKAAAASAAAAKSSWAAAKAPFVRMASMLAMRAGAADAARAGSTKATGGGYVQGWGSSSRGKGDVRKMGSRGGVGAGHGKNGMNGVGSAGACRGKQKGGGGGGDNSIDSDDDVCAGLVQGANKLHDHGASKGGSPVGSVASGEGDEYDGEEDLMDMLRWLWGHRSSEDGMEAGSEEEGHEEEEESTDELDEDRGGDEGEAEGWIMDAAIAAAHAAASTLAGLPSAAAAALSSQSKYVRAAAMAAAMATAAAAHSAGLPVAGAAAAAAAAVGIARRRALRDVLQSAGRPPTAALRELLLQVGGSVPAHGSLRGMLAQVGGNVPSLEALREMLQQARGNVPSREGVREMLHSAYLQYVGGWAGGPPAQGSSSSSSSRSRSGSKCGGASGDSSSSEGSAHRAWAAPRRASCDTGVGGKGEGFVVDGAGDGGERRDGVCMSGRGRGVRQWGWDGSMDGAGGGGAGKEGLEGFVAAVLAELRRRALKGGAAMRTRWRHPQHAQRVVSAAAADDLRSACDEAAFAASLERGDVMTAAPNDVGAAWDEGAFAASLEGPLAARHKREAEAAREPRRSLCQDIRASGAQDPQLEGYLGSHQPQQWPGGHLWSVNHSEHQQHHHHHHHPHHGHQQNTSHEQQQQQQQHYGHLHQTQHPGSPKAPGSKSLHISSAHHSPSPDIRQQDKLHAQQEQQRGHQEGAHAPGSPAMHLGLDQQEGNVTVPPFVASEQGGGQQCAASSPLPGHVRMEALARPAAEGLSKQRGSLRVFDSEQCEQWFDAQEGGDDGEGDDECTAALDADRLAGTQCGGLQA